MITDELIEILKKYPGKPVLIDGWEANLDDIAEKNVFQHDVYLGFLSQENANQSYSGKHRPVFNHDDPDDFEHMVATPCIVISRHERGEYEY